MLAREFLACCVYLCQERLGFFGSLFVPGCAACPGWRGRKQRWEAEKSQGAQRGAGLWLERL